VVRRDLTVKSDQVSSKKSAGDDEGIQRHLTDTPEQQFLAHLDEPIESCFSGEMLECGTVCLTHNRAPFNCALGCRGEIA